MAWGETGQRLNEILERNEHAFTNLAEQFDIDDWDWWESRNIAERGPLSSTFTSECCRMILFGDCLDRGGAHLFIVEAEDMACTFRSEARRRGIAARWIGPDTAGRLVRRAGRSAVAALRFIRAVIRRTARILRLRALRRRHPIAWERMRGCAVLFAAWTGPDEFDRERVRGSAHYMGALPRDMRAAGHASGYIALPLDWIYDADSIHRGATATEEAVIVADDAVSIVALWHTAVGAVVRRARPKPGFSVAGQPLGTVAAMVLARERFDWRAVDARLLAEIGPFLARHGCLPKAVFHVYENQTWEKGLRSGFRRALPETLVFGFHQSPFSRMYLNMLPSRAELGGGRWPDVVFTHGARSRRQLMSTGAPADRVVDGGLFRQGSFILERRSGAGTGRRAVVATGVDYQECCELVAKVADAIAGSDWALTINFHPATGPSFRARLRQFLNFAGMPSDRMDFSEQSISSILAEGADVVFYADTNAAFEAVSVGARVVNVERDHALSFDKLPEGLSRRLYSPGEIRHALDEASNDDLWPGAGTVGQALADCFTPPDPSAVVSALEHLSGWEHENSLERKKLAR